MNWYEQEPKHPIVISSRVRIARNLKKYNFGFFLEEEKAREIIQMVKEVIFSSSFKSDEIFESIDFDNLKEAEKYEMVEKNIASPNFLKSQKPKYLIINKKENLDIMINEEDHIRIQSINTGYSIDECFEQANRIDDFLSEKLDYAFDEEFGHLTTCVTNVGTGLRASFMLHIPMIKSYGHLSVITENISKYGMVIRGSYGEGTDAFGDIYQISNQATMGKDEEQIIQELKNIMLKIIEREENLRRRALSEDDINLKDKVYRSLGVLKYCKKISVQEAIKNLSNLWLGLDTKILQNNCLPKLNIYNIIVNIQTASLINNFNIEEKREVDIYRAKYINEVVRYE